MANGILLNKHVKCSPVNFLHDQVGSVPKFVDFKVQNLWCKLSVQALDDLLFPLQKSGGGLAPSDFDGDGLSGGDLHSALDLRVRAEAEEVADLVLFVHVVPVLLVQLFVYDRQGKQLLPCFASARLIDGLHRD